MSDLTLTITLTDAGMAAVAAAHGQGLQAKITHVAVGDQGYAPSAAATTLHNELARVALTAGGPVPPQQVLLQGMVPADGQDFFIRELGYFLEDGTLLGVWSDPATPLGWIGGATPWFFKLAFSWSALPADSITVIIADDAGQAGMALDLAQNEAKVRYAVEMSGQTWGAEDQTQLWLAIQKAVQAGAHSIAIRPATFAAGVTDGKPVRWDASNSRFALAVADGTVNNLGVGIADVTNATVVCFGECRAGLLAGLTPGARYYLSSAVAGGLVTVPPPDAVKVGIAKSADILFVDIDQYVASGIGEDFTDLGSGTALLLDGNGKAAIKFTMSGTTAVSSANLSAGKVYSFMVKLCQDATGSRAFTLPANTKWPYGEVPAWPTAANAWSKFVLETWDAGATWEAAFIGAAYA